MSTTLKGGISEWGDRVGEVHTGLSRKVPLCPCCGLPFPLLPQEGIRGSYILGLSRCQKPRALNRAPQCLSMPRPLCPCTPLPG